MREQTFLSLYIMSVPTRAKRAKHGKWARGIEGDSPSSMFSHLLAVLRQLPLLFSASLGLFSIMC